mgnify:CR=1 FL=1
MLGKTVNDFKITFIRWALVAVLAGTAAGVGPAGAGDVRLEHIRPHVLRYAPTPMDLRVPPPAAPVKPQVLFHGDRIRKQVALTFDACATKTASGYDEEVIEATLGRLLEHGYLNDAEFARYWVENRQRFRPKGPQALRQELRQRGVDRDDIDETLSDLDTAEAAYRAAEPRAARMAALAREDPATFRRKLSEFLLRRGFAHEAVQEVVRRLLREMTT